MTERDQPLRGSQHCVPEELRPPWRREAAVETEEVMDMDECRHRRAEVAPGAVHLLEVEKIGVAGEFLHARAERAAAEVAVRPHQRVHAGRPAAFVERHVENLDRQVRRRFASVDQQTLMRRERSPRRKGRERDPVLAQTAQKRDRAPAGSAAL